MKNTVLEINRLAECEPAAFVRAEEDAYVREIHAIAQTIADDDDLKIVSIAGPSASGKTTTAHILRDRLNALGENTSVVSLDNFYLPTEQLPVLPDGKKDIESVNSLDIPLIEKCLNELIRDGKTMLPAYDFMNRGRKLNAVPLDIGTRGIVIAEGLHALNPLITDLVPRRNIYKIYISVNCPVLDENGKQLLSSRQMRLVRRALRDEIFRGSDISETLSLWNGVVTGEKKYLYCFKDTADVQLKTLHLYEPCLFRNRFVAMREELKPDAPCREYFLRTAAALEQFAPLDAAFVPEDSLIREFIGSGKYN